MTPTAVSRYIAAAIARSAGVTRRFQSRAAAAIVAANGTITAPRLAVFSSLVRSLPMRSSYAEIGNMN